MASRSMINGRSRSIPRSGASFPARFHTRPRTATLAWLIAANAACGVAANASINRDTVGSEATRPNTAGSARTTEMSDRQSPPMATLIAGSSRIFPGSKMAHCLRQGANASDSARSKPTLPAVATSSTAPAWDTTRFAVVSTVNGGYKPVRLDTRKVLLFADDVDLRDPHYRR